MARSPCPIPSLKICLADLNAMGPVVDVAAVFSEEPDKRKVEPASDVDSKAARGGDGAEDRDAGGDAFLGELEACPTTHEDHTAVSGETSIQHCPAEQFVEGVVAADVFAHGHQGAVRVEERGRMETTGAIKEPLSRA